MNARSTRDYSKISATLRVQAEEPAPSSGGTMPSLQPPRIDDQPQTVREVRRRSAGRYSIIKGVRRRG